MASPKDRIGFPLRLKPEEKELIKKASEKARQSMNCFIIEAAENRALNLLK